MKLADFVLELEPTEADLKTIKKMMIRKMSLLIEYMEALYNIILKVAKGGDTRVGLGSFGF